MNSGTLRGWSDLLRPVAILRSRLRGRRGRGEPRAVQGCLQGGGDGEEAGPGRGMYASVQEPHAPIVCELCEVGPENAEKARWDLTLRQLWHEQHRPLLRGLRVFPWRTAAAHLPYRQRHCLWLPIVGESQLLREGAQSAPAELAAENELVAVRPNPPSRFVHHFQFLLSYDPVSPHNL